MQYRPVANTKPCTCCVVCYIRNKGLVITFDTFAQKNVAGYRLYMKTCRLISIVEERVTTFGGYSTTDLEQCKSVNVQLAFIFYM
jgi:hypothetical protein